ncbi:4Fe-4S dicluster domain-containing protein [Desulfonatronospira sp.]|uniref:4Fe-4S dicluster domain-containing protein n=1 Tax=Desulfonatronospira sp. TaxID=1962951 RepID=UPI0025BF82DF|nr:4Fe-4S dicluster domain-containing protein [Desulfonatronospira sp.]
MASKRGESRVKVFRDWCKGCGICAAFCPGKVLSVDKQGNVRVDHEDECINCGFCEIHCPDFAIMVYPREERPPFEANIEDVAPATREELHKTRNSNSK